MKEKKNTISRRAFLGGLGAAASLTILKPSLVWGSAQNEKIRLGLIGCGDRGTWIAHLFQEHGGYHIAAAADYFPEKAKAFGETFNIEGKNLFSGLSGYRQLLDAGIVDAIAIESPSYFHPEQAAAAVAAGCHVYLAKPVAVDVPGCNTISESAEKATSKKQVFLVDFQTRTDPFYIEAVQRIHAGGLGKIAFAESTFHGDCPWKKWYPALQEDPGNPEHRLRGWGVDRALAGDIIVEQSIHTIDVDTWVIDKPPVSAIASGGQLVRPVGNAWDYLTVHYKYPDDISVNFSGKQFKGHGTLGGIRNRIFGSEGVLEAQYGGEVLLRGEHFYRGGKTPGIYKEGAQRNIATFHENIKNGVYDNPTVAPSVRSTLTAILGRNAGYSGSRLTWDELLKSTEKLEADLDGLKA